MAFNKEEYWKRRNNTEVIGSGKDKREVPRPLRGQGDKPVAVAQPLDKEKYVVLSHGQRVKRETIAKGRLFINGNQVTTKEGAKK